MVMNSLLELKEDLEPVYEFTTMCEIENANQADVYIHYRSFKVKLQARLTTRATRLLKLDMRILPELYVDDLNPSLSLRDYQNLYIKKLIQTYLLY